MDKKAIDILVDVLNCQPGILAIKMDNALSCGRPPYIHVVKNTVMGRKYLTVSDYDGNAWLIKTYLEGVEVFEHISTTPVELVNFIMEKI